MQTQTPHQQVTQTTIRKRWPTGKWLFAALLALLGIRLTLAPPATQGQELEPIARMAFTSQGVEWQPVVEYTMLTLVITTPDGNIVQQTFVTGQTPVFALLDPHGQPYPDGVYTYELRRTMHIAQTRSDEATPNEDLQKATAVTRQSGTFSIAQGALAAPDTLEASPQIQALQAPNDQVIIDDLIVTGSSCIGTDCVNGELFGADTIRLRENNLQIHFDDTSNAGTFPNNDWRIIINDSASGGASYFAIEDSTAVRVPFKLMAGAPANAFYMDAYGRLGLGTATPFVELHIVDGDTPTVRLDQDGSGFPAYIWDVSGNEYNFFIKDVTNSSTIPFRIQPGTPSNALTLRSDGNMGLGTWSPAYPVELERTGTNATFAAQRTDGATAVLTAAAAETQIGSLTNHPLALMVNNTPAMTLNNGGELQVHNAGITWTLSFTDTGLTIAPNNGSPNAFVLDPSGNLTLAGAVIESSDVNVKENFAPVDPAEVLAQVLRLPITTWNYQADTAVRHMGPMAQDFYAAFGLGTDNRHIAPLDANGVTLAAIQALAQQNQAQENRLTQLEQENADLAARLAALEALVLEMAQD